MLRKEPSVPTPRLDLPWRDALAGAALTVAAFFFLPLLAPESLIGLSEELILGIISGLIVGLGLRLDPRAAWLLAVSSVVGVSARFLIDGDPPRVVLPLAALIGIEIWVLIYIIRRLGADRLARPQDVLLLVLVSAAVGFASGLLAGLLLQIVEPGLDQFSHALRSWGIDDVFGIVCIAPAVITLHRPSRWRWAHVTEFTIVAVLTAAIAYFMFRVIDPANPGLVGYPYLVVLGPLWIAVRLGVQAVAPVTAALAWFAATSTAVGMGAFSNASSSPLDRLIAVQLFSIVVALTLLLLAVLRDSRLASMTALKESSLLLREVVDGSQALVFAKSYEGDAAGTGRYVLVNEAWREQTGLSVEQTVGSTDPELFPPEAAAAFLEHDLEVMDAAAPIMVEEIAPAASGEVRTYSSSKFPLRRSDGSVWGVGGIATDTTDLVRLLERERKQAGLLRAVFELSPTPALRVSIHPDGEIQMLAANSAMCALMGAEVGQMDSCVLMEHVHPDDAASARGVLAEAQRGRGPRPSGSVRQREVRMLSLDGQTVWTLMSAATVGAPSEAADTEIVVQFEDFTARRRAEEALSNQALRDAVTGLPNRRALQDRLSSALMRLHRQNGVLAVLFCDLDRFKDVNDTQGHQAGDLLLVEVARRMQAALRPEDTVARLGGDEFVALGEGIADVASAVQMAMRLLEKVSVPWVEGDQTYRPSISIGVAIVEDPTLTADEVLRRADLAMYRQGQRSRPDRDLREVRRRPVPLRGRPSA